MSDARSARTTELGDAIGRTAVFFDTNYDRYGEALSGLRITRETLEAQARTVDVQTSHAQSLTRNHHHDIDAAMHTWGPVPLEISAMCGGAAA